MKVELKPTILTSIKHSVCLQQILLLKAQAVAMLFFLFEARNNWVYPVCGGGVRKPVHVCISFEILFHTLYIVYLESYNGK